jgi:hypothetical protein
MSDAAETRKLGAGTRSTPKLEARYANYFEVGHNAFEFMLDFGQFHADDETAQMQYRVVTGPVHAKLLAEMLDSSIERYEQEHGAIRCVEDDVDPLELVHKSISGYDPRASAQSGGTPRK